MAMVVMVNLHRVTPAESPAILGIYCTIRGGGRIYGASA
jgi:hypothetical protein